MRVEGHKVLMTLGSWAVAVGNESYGYSGYKGRGGEDIEWRRIRRFKVAKEKVKGGEKRKKEGRWKGLRWVNLSRAHFAKRLLKFQIAISEILPFGGTSDQMSDIVEEYMVSRGGLGGMLCEVRITLGIRWRLIPHRAALTKSCSTKNHVLNTPLKKAKKNPTPKTKKLSSVQELGRKIPGRTPF